MYDFVSSDHKPVCVNFYGFVTCTATCNDSTRLTYVTTEWSTVDSYSLELFSLGLTKRLSNVNIPYELLVSNDACNPLVAKSIGCYYEYYTKCITEASHACLPKKRFSSFS